MDESELATQHEELRRAIAIQMRRPEGPAATGQCLFCDEPLPAGQRWCNPECREDWNRIQFARRQRS